MSEADTRETEIQRKDVPVETRIRVWAKAAGRCELCGAYLLDGAGSFLHAVSFGQIAHIVGATPGKNSPRGESDLTADERAGEENLLLLCYRCHKRIDDKAYRDRYTTEFLRQKKQHHERRVREVTDFATLRPTSVVTVSADIHGTAAPISLAQVAEALRREGFTGMGDDTRNGAFTLELPGNENDGWAWDAHRTELDRLTMRVAEAIAAGDIETVSVFALAPIPTLVYLGSKLDDKTEIRLFRRKRIDDMTAWAWDDGVSTTKFSVALDTSLSSAQEATVIIELSSSVKKSRLPSDLTSLPRVTISPTGQLPSPELISTLDALEEFGKVWRETLARIEKNFSNVRKLHLIASVPTAAAIAMGRYRMRATQPTMVVYQLNNESYEAAIEITE